MPHTPPSKLKMTSGAIDDKDEALAFQLCSLAGAVLTVGHTKAERLQQETAQSTLENLIKQCLLQKNDEVLYEGLEQARFTDSATFAQLKSYIEEAAEAVLVRRTGQPTMEINAFVIPLFARSVGGLQVAQDFQDQAAFELLTESIKQAGLESPHAQVVLLSHAYHLDEIDGISYSHLHEMIRDVAACLADKKHTAIPAIERSFSGWPACPFGAADAAMELRFLVGFSRKKIDDAFYQPPADETAADDWFADRAARFQAWCALASPLVQRCLANDGRQLDIDFLYQDGFYGGKESGMDEYFMLQMLSELRAALVAHPHPLNTVSATVASVVHEGERLVQVSLMLDQAAQAFACVSKPCLDGLDTSEHLNVTLADVVDAIASLGLDPGNIHRLQS